MKLRSMAYGLALACIALACSAFTACSTDGGQKATPQTSIFEVEQNYNHALAVGAWYGSQDDCETSVDKIFCSKKDIRQKIKDAKDVAGPIVAGARDTVRNPLFDASTASAITLGADAAVRVLLQITDPLEDLLGKAIAAGKAKPLPDTAARAKAKPTAYMEATPDSHPITPALAGFDLMGALYILQMLLKIVPEGTAQWLKIKQDRDQLDAIKAEGRNPTDEEWQTLINETAALESQIDANAAR